MGIERGARTLKAARIRRLHFILYLMAVFTYFR